MRDGFLHMQRRQLGGAARSSSAGGDGGDADLGQAEGRVNMRQM